VTAHCLPSLTVSRSEPPFEISYRALSSQCGTFSSHFSRIKSGSTTRTDSALFVLFQTWTRRF